MVKASSCIKQKLDVILWISKKRLLNYQLDLALHLNSIDGRILIEEKEKCLKAE
jgi:hypothetical protein